MGFRCRSPKFLGERRRAKWTVCQSDLIAVPDMTQDDRFRDLAYVAGAPHVRFPAGVPLINILPVSIAAELMQHQTVERRYHPSVTILFADFRDFTSFAETMEPRAEHHPSRRRLPCCPRHPGPCGRNEPAARDDAHAALGTANRDPHRWRDGRRGGTATIHLDDSPTTCGATR
jgi:hypothetical protein